MRRKKFLWFLSIVVIIVFWVGYRAYFNYLETNKNYSKFYGAIDRKFINDMRGIVDDNILQFICRVHKDKNSVGLYNPVFATIASSYIAEGLRNYYYEHKDKRASIIKALDNIVQTNISRGFNPYKKNLYKVKDYGNYGVYLAHMNIILGEYESVAHDGKYKELNKKISYYLREKSLLDPTRHVPSYNDRRSMLRWPADQVAVLFSLYLYDKNYGTHISDVPINEWLEYMDRYGIDPKTGLHKSEITGKEKYSSVPRGCALSWSIRYMSYFDKRKTKIIWERYKKSFLKDYLIVAGFREYPKGSMFIADIDSGPIINGIGASATVLGIGAANAMGDMITYYKLKNMYFMAKIGLYIIAPKKRRLMNDLLSSAIMFCMKNQ